MTTDRARAAQAALEIPLFTDVLDELEQAAINACLNANYDDHAARQHHALDAVAVRKLRSKLQAIAREGQSTSRTAPA